jgi:hypothetical protein
VSQMKILNQAPKTWDREDGLRYCSHNHAAAPFLSTRLRTIRRNRIKSHRNPRLYVNQRLQRRIHVTLVAQVYEPYQSIIQLLRGDPRRQRRYRRGFLCDFISISSNYSKPRAQKGSRGMVM